MAGAENLSGKTLIDITNPLDFSKGFPPTLFVCNDDSLGEQIQRAFPEAKVVKTLHTVTAALMVDFPVFLHDSQTVSMGLGPIMSIYQARFLRYLKSRDLLPGKEPRVWCGEVSSGRYQRRSIQLQLPARGLVLPVLVQAAILTIG